MKIVTRFLIVNTCFIQNGLLPPDINSQISCSLTSNVMTITSFQPFVKSQQAAANLVKIKFNAQTIAITGRSLPVEIYTYTDSTFLTKVDQSTTEANTVVQIDSLPPVQPATVLTVSNQNAGQLMIIQGTVVPLQNYTNPVSVVLKFVFPSAFTIGASDTVGPVCNYETFYQYETGLVVNSVDKQGLVNCQKSSYSSHVLQFPLTISNKSVPLLKKSPLKLYLNLFNSVSITNIRNPIVGGSYSINMFVLASSSLLPLEYYSLTFTVTPVTFAFTISSSNINKNGLAFINLVFSAPFDMIASNRTLSNFYGNFTQIKISFPQKIGSAAAWNFNLQYNTLSSGQLIDCWPQGSLDPYWSNVGCQLLFGRDPAIYTLSTADYVNIIVRDYKAISIGNSVSISFFATFPNMVAAPTITVGLHQIIQGFDTTIISATNPFPAPVTILSPQNSFTSYLATSTYLYSESYTGITITFSIPTNYLLSDTPSLIITLPAGWKFSKDSSSLSTCTFDSQVISSPQVEFNRYVDKLVIFAQTGLSAGVHTIDFTNIFIQYGASLTNVIKTELLIQKKVIYTGVVDLGPIACYPISTYSFSASPNLGGLQGATYELDWVTNRFYNNSNIVFSLPTSYYTFLATIDYGFTLLVNSNEISENLFSTTFLGNTLTVSFSNVS